MGRGSSRRAQGGEYVKKKPDVQEARTMTKRDWQALHLAWTLCREIVVHGHKALDTFIDAMIESRGRE